MQLSDIIDTITNFSKISIWGKASIIVIIAIVGWIYAVRIAHFRGIRRFFMKDKDYFTEDLGRIIMAYLFFVYINLVVLLTFNNVGFGWFFLASVVIFGVYKFLKRKNEKNKLQGWRITKKIAKKNNGSAEDEADILVMFFKAMALITGTFAVLLFMIWGFATNDSEGTISLGKTVAITLIGTFLEVFILYSWYHILDIRKSTLKLIYKGKQYPFYYKEGDMLVCGKPDTPVEALDNIEFVKDFCLFNIKDVKGNDGYIEVKRSFVETTSSKSLKETSEKSINVTIRIKQ